MILESFNESIMKIGPFAIGISSDTRATSSTDKSKNSQSTRNRLDEYDIVETRIYFKSELEQLSNDTLFKLLKPTKQRLFDTGEMFNFKFADLYFKDNELVLRMQFIHGIDFSKMPQFINEVFTTAQSFLGDNFLSMRVATILRNPISEE